MDDVPVASAVPALFGPGSRVASYVLEEKIGSGGMAEVWRAHGVSNGRKVALKILALELAADLSFRQRFLRESRLVVQLDHANILPVYKAAQDGETLFIAMQLVRGGDVRSLLDRGPLPLGRIAEIVSQVAEALDFAHQRGLVHRDVRPRNMLLDEPGVTRRDHVYLSDFGLAWLPPDITHVTITWPIAGTLDYTAPEQLNGEEMDGRADQYSLACSAFELLCGEPPFHRYSRIGAPLAAYAHLNDSPPRNSSDLVRPAAPRRGVRGDQRRASRSRGRNAAGG